MKNEQTLRRDRDVKAMPHLEQYAPVWIASEKSILGDEAIQFEVVFQHHEYGWVQRRYRYDGFNDVLYHKGQLAISEEQALKIQEQDPYIAALVADIPNAYGG
jgi:hypothetical protein